MRGFRLTLPWDLCWQGLTLYNFLITVDQEVKTIWTQKFTKTSLLLVMTRWSTLLYSLCVIIPPTSEKVSEDFEFHVGVLKLTIMCLAQAYVHHPGENQDIWRC